MSRINRFHCLSPFLLARFTFLCAVAWCATWSTHAATLRVEKAGGTGIYTNINDAIKAATAGSTIRIGPGTYEEHVVVSKNLELIGAGPQYVTIAPTVLQGSAIAVNDRVSATIRSMSLTAVNGYGVQVRNQPTTGDKVTTTVANCVIYGAQYGIVHDSLTGGLKGVGAQILVEHCSIVRSSYNALYVRTADGAGWLHVRNCIFSRNGEFRPEVSQPINRDQADYSVVNTLIFGKQSSDTPSVANVDPQFTNEELFNFTLQPGSAAMDGAPFGEIDPDGTRADLGAYGGPGSAAFWPYRPGGPIIQDISVSPLAISQGGRITIKATATTR